MVCGGVELFQQLLGARDKLLKQFRGRDTSATGLKPGVNETGGAEEFLTRRANLAIMTIAFLQPLQGGA